MAARNPFENEDEGHHRATMQRATSLGDFINPLGLRSDQSSQSCLRLSEPARIVRSTDELNACQNAGVNVDAQLSHQGRSANENAPTVTGKKSLHTSRPSRSPSDKLFNGRGFFGVSKEDYKQSEIPQPVKIKKTGMIMSITNKVGNLVSDCDERMTHTYRSSTRRSKLI